MSQPYIGEIRMFAGNFAPAGWALCQGQLVPISENDALFNLIGTTYGGDGQNTFALPNLQSRVPVHVGPGFALGQAAGAESVTLTVTQIPAHSHVLQGNSNAATANNPTGGVLANQSGDSTAPSLYIPTPTSQQALSPSEIGSTGGSQPHDNMIPYLVINFIISLFGIFPSQS